MKLKLYILFGLLFVGLVGAAFWYFSATAATKIAWLEPPVYQGQQQENVQITKGGTRKETSLIVNDYDAAAIQLYTNNLIDADWDAGSHTGKSGEFTYIDRKKNLNIGGFFLYENTCPAFYLSVAIEAIDSNKTRVRTVQNVGPCGSPFV